MKYKLEVVVWPNPRKRLEFKQTLECLVEDLHNCCSSLMINVSENGLNYTILAQWENSDQMRHTLRSNKFSILYGAIIGLCDNTVIRIDGKPAGNDIAKLLEF